MKLFKLFVLFFLFFPFFSFAQQEQWDTYMAKFAGKPGSIMVDLGLQEKAPDKLYPYLVITGPKTVNCDHQGLPDKDQINAMEEILDASSNFITGITAKKLTGTFTCNCERLNYYYVKDTVSIRNALQRMYARSFPNYEYVLKMKLDKEWKTYRTFLYPTENDQIWMENNKLLTGMIAKGDSLIKIRPIQFVANFTKDSMRNLFINDIAAAGFITKIANDSMLSNYPYLAMITQTIYPKIEIIDSINVIIKNTAQKYKGIYNGWSSPIIK